MQGDTCLINSAESQFCGLHGTTTRTTDDDRNRKANCFKSNLCSTCLAFTGGIQTYVLTPPALGAFEPFLHVKGIKDDRVSKDRIILVAKCVTKMKNITPLSISRAQ